MSDPAQVIQQFERYAQEGRMEIAEVMSTELTQRLLAEKKRDVEVQTLLVRTLRCNADILITRSKNKEAFSAATLLLKHSKILLKMANSAKRNDLIDSCNLSRAGDHMLAARAAMGLKRLSAVKKNLNRASKAQPGHIEAALLGVEARARIRGSLRGAGRDVSRLVNALQKAGPVISHSGRLFLEPTGQDPCELTTLLPRLHEVSTTPGLSGACTKELAAAVSELQRQQQAIMTGEQAANARLSAAIDKLNPTMDYHTYSKGN